jgi:hypothetical protein
VGGAEGLDGATVALQERGAGVVSGKQGAQQNTEQQQQQQRAVLGEDPQQVMGAEGMADGEVIGGAEMKDATWQLDEAEEECADQEEAGAELIADGVREGDTTGAAPSSHIFKWLFRLAVLQQVVLFAQVCVVCLCLAAALQSLS